MLGKWSPPPVGGELKVSCDGGWGGSPLLVVLHQKPSSLPFAAQTTSHLAGRRHGVTGRHATCSAIAFCHQQPRGVPLLVSVATTPKSRHPPECTMGSRWLYMCSSDMWMMSTLCSGGNKLGCNSRTSCLSKRGVVLEGANQESGYIGAQLRGILGAPFFCDNPGRTISRC
jgi:hypothetical protein